MRRFFHFSALSAERALMQQTINRPAGLRYFAAIRRGGFCSEACFYSAFPTVNVTDEASGDTVPSAARARTSSLKKPSCFASMAKFQ